MRKYFSKISIICLSLFLVAQFASAQIPTSGTLPQSKSPLGRIRNIILGTPSFATNTYEGTLTVFIGQIINVFLSLLGTIFIFLMIYAGYNWMTAAGTQEKVEKAQHTLKVAIIGLIITASAFAIWQFIFIRLLTR